MMRAIFISSLATALSTALLGCATPRRDGAPRGVPERTVGLVQAPGADYGAVFDAVREVLREYRFAVNRVDAERGVITTRLKRTAGLASPWDREQSSFAQEWEDLVNQQHRTVRVTFQPDQTEPIRAVIEVQLQRVHRPYWRIETESIGLSTHARARDELGEPMQASFTETVGLDVQLARRIAASVEAMLARRGAADE